MKLEISDDDLPRVLASLALGAMRAFEAGVPGGGGELFALSAPGTLLPLRIRARLSEELASTISWLSELDTLRDIVLDDMLAAKLSHRADLLEAELRKDNPERIWDIRWLPEADYSAPDLIDLLNRPGPSG